MVDESFADRARRLTPREWRVVALVIEGVSSQDACSALGVAPGTLESHKQAVRRKLGIPRGKRLDRHLRENLESLPIPLRQKAETAQAQRELRERRVRWLLRITMQELIEVAANAELRSALLEQTIKRIESVDADDARGEVEDLKFLAAEVRKTQESVLAEIRARAARATVEKNGALTP